MSFGVMYPMALFTLRYLNGGRFLHFQLRQDKSKDPCLLLPRRIRSLLHFHSVRVLGNYLCIINGLRPWIWLPILLSQSKKNPLA